MNTSLPSDGSTGFLSRLPAAGELAVVIGAGRTAIGLAFLAAPLTSVRVLGLDTATAERVKWLAQMVAVRDGVIGAGTLASARRRSGPAWLLAGAAADLTDGVVITSALRQGRLRGLAARAVACGALVASAAGVWAAVTGRTKQTQPRVGSFRRRG